MGSLAEVTQQSYCCLCLVDDNADSTQKTHRSPVVTSSERCHTDALQTKTYCPGGLQLQGLPLLQRASSLAQCPPVPRMTTSSD